MQSLMATPDGVSLAVRPLERTDRAALAAGFARLGPETRYRRFASPVPRLPERQLDRLVDLDHHAREALVAYDAVTGEGLAVARWATFPGADGEAEIAITVTDAWQGRGLGTVLGQRLVERARAEGFHRLHATVLAENRRAQALARRLGFRPAGRGGLMSEWVLDLEAVRLSELAA
jgi:RimJ/RimL family protein N-acetyltransferase